MMVVTIAFGSSLLATWRDATMLAPDDVPTNKPSSFANLRAIAFASSDETGMISLTWPGSHRGGMKPIPIPSMLWDPVGFPESTADSAGSTADTCSLELYFLKILLTP